MHATSRQLALSQRRQHDNNKGHIPTTCQYAALLHVTMTRKLHWAVPRDVAEIGLHCCLSDLSLSLGRGSSPTRALSGAPACCGGGE